MKFLERFTLVVYSYIMLIIAVILGLTVLDFISFPTISNITEELIKGDVSSKVLLAISAVFVLLSIKCIFFDESSKEKAKQAQGILLKNENGQLMISKDSIDNMVKNAVNEFNQVKECNTKIHVNADNQIFITLFITVREDAIIKDLATELQLKVKESVKNISDLDVEEVNVKIVKLQEDKKSKE